jgi:hypothetical protein
MSYLKLFKTCSDHAVGYQSVNQAVDNNLALYQQIDAKHAVGNEQNDIFQPLGRHDDVLVARTVADFKVVAGPNGTNRAFPLVSGPLLVNPPTELATGQWRIPVATPTIFHAVATIKGASAGNARYATCYVLAGLSNAFVIVSTWNVTGGVLASYDFSLVLWSEGIA